MSHIRYRRNINCLSTSQLHDLREALATMYSLPAADEHSFTKIGGIHGSPAPSYCIHGYPGFLTWHRAYLDVFEKALRCINSNITLPFWNWSSGPTTGVPQACRESTYINQAGDTAANPLYAGPIPAALGGGMTSRRADIDTTIFGDLATSAQSALTQANLGGFQSALNGPHGGVHVRVGGNMSSVAMAGFDPIFYLHHANVDRLWATWQVSHPAALPANEANLELEPFNKPYSSNWRLGSEVETTEMLGYRYTNFCFFIFPWPLKALIPLKIDREIIRQFETARLTLKADRMPIQSTEFRVFVSEAEAHGDAIFSGSVTLFGMGDEKLMSAERNRGKSFDVSLDISEAIKQRCASDKDSELALSILAFDQNGNSLSEDKVNIKGLELLID